MSWLGEAKQRRVRVSDRYRWVYAYVLDATVATALQQHDEATARTLVTTLESLPARCDMREFTVRALVHRAQLGESSALASARLLAAGIDNPALQRLASGA